MLFQWGRLDKSAPGFSGADGAAAAPWSGAGIDDGSPDVALRALPPDFFVAACGHLLRGQGAVERRVPLGGQSGGAGRQIVEPRQDLSARAIGAATAPGGPGGHGGGVVVTQLAAPPDLPVGVGGDLAGGQGSVLGGMPLGGQGREGAGQVIFPGEHLFAGAHRAACPPNPGDHGGLPLVALGALPPHLPLGPGGDVAGAKGPVLLRVPLPGQLRVGGGQVILPRRQPAVGAHRAARALDPGIDIGLPNMVPVAAPPNLPVAARQDLRRGQVPVFVGVPLGGQLGILGRQIGFPRPGLAPRAVGATAARARAGVNRGLPPVPLGAAPPDLPVAAVGDLRGVPVFLKVPLLKQSHFVVGQAVVLQGRSQSCLTTSLAPGAQPPAGDKKVYFSVNRPVRLFTFNIA